MTPAVELLLARRVAHQLLSYDHDRASDSYGLEAAVALDLDPAIVFKTLLASTSSVSGQNEEHIVALVPVTHQLDLKALASAAKAKRVSMTDAAIAERVTGYVVGGISPFGQKKKHRTFVDKSAVEFGQINVSGGRRGLEIVVAPTDLIELLDAETHDLTSRPTS